jgi:ubiquinone/menaquinone biosynthesis C-methylase UbiE
MAQTPGRYAQEGNRAFESLLAARSASADAAFLLPHLRRGMQLVDVGCGPGSITLDLAHAVAPGDVVGIDSQPQAVKQANAAAAAGGVPNARFDVAHAYALPFPAESFDCAFANGLLMHLSEPRRALAEMHRVLRPGGIVGIRDPDFGGFLFAPATALLARWFTVRLEVRRHYGCDPFLSRQYRRLLLEAGFDGAQASASVNAAGTSDATSLYATFLKAQLRGYATTVLAERWMDEATLEAVVTELDSWAKQADAFVAATWCAALAWKPVPHAHGQLA